MDEALWGQFHDFLYRLNYIRRYCAFCKRVDTYCSIITAFVSSIAIAGWNIWTCVPWLWSVLIVLAQIIHFIKPYLPYEKHLYSLKYFEMDLSPLVNELENTWRKTRYESSDALSDLFRQYKDKYDCLNTKYLGLDGLPEIKSVRALAIKDAHDYFRTYYRIEWSDE